ncbi:MAG: proton-coupled thiamine transporter YuaJ [Ruminococcaceae bacterium]|nr:proton-coupled thiamine transporter YuaJ [Oscillospiraceae bacterium]
MKNKKTQLLAEGAIMVALATVLSFIRIVKFPWGGSITLFSMLPIVFFSIRHGVKNGVFVSGVYALVQLGQGILFDGLFGWGLTPVALISCILLDYLVAFGALCLAGLFGNKSFGAIIGGVLLATGVRFFTHFLSGVLIFGSFGELWGGIFVENSWLYSLLYNGAYMLPETIITAIGAILIFRTKQMRKLLFPEER